MKIQSRLLLIIISFFISEAGYSQEYQPHTDILAAATLYVETALATTAEKEIMISPLDRRLMLNACKKPLQAFLPTGAKLSGKTTIGVRCHDKKPWKLFVTATIKIYAQIIIASDHIERGSLIQKHHLKSVKKETSLISRGYYESPEQVIGKIARYSIYKDGIIHPHSIKKPKLIKRGQDVVIQARAGGIIVKMRGTAAADGTLGDIVKIKNKHSRRVIHAKVIGANLVEVAM